MNTNPAAIGIKTSEFWLSLLGIAGSILVAKGIIGVSQLPGFINQTTQDVVSIYSGVVAIIAIYKIIKQYVDSRTAIKTQLLTKQTTV